MNRENHEDPPVLLITYNRPETTRQVLLALQHQKPRNLFVASDGPKDFLDSPKVNEVRRLVAEMVDWPCELRLNYSNHNLGCRKGVTRAIDWFFSEVDEGIILEDDTVPHPDFFPFCGHLLERYRDDPEVMHISGDNSARVSIKEDWSYCFIRYPHIWGWATWKSSWEQYDRNLSKFEQFLKSGEIN